MKGITFLHTSAALFVRLPQAMSCEYNLDPVELWLLVKLQGHQDGVYTPSVKEISDAGKVDGGSKVPNIKTLEAAYKRLQAKGYVQVRLVRTNGHGAVWVRSITMEARIFSRDLLGPGAPTDEELTTEIVRFNEEQRRPDLVRQAYERRARRERAAGGNVISLDERRAAKAG